LLLILLKIMAGKKQQENERVVYREFGEAEPAEALERPEVPPQQQNLKIQASRKGRGGKTVTEITGWQASAETLQQVTKQLKNQCGTGGTCKEESIEIQGDHRQKILEILTKLGYKCKISGG
jgi:translation initiation factor 1